MKRTIIFASFITLTILLTSCSAKAPKAYEFGTDSIPSMTEAVGDRTLTDVDKTSESGAEQQTYRYIGAKDTSADVARYVDALRKSGAFLTEDYDPSLPKGRACLVIPSKEEGKIITVVITYNKEECIVALEKFKGDIIPGAKPKNDTPAEPLPQEPEHSAECVPPTAQQAMEILSGYSKESLGLPAEITSYTLVLDDSPSDINGDLCHGISVFADLGERMESMGIFYLSCDRERVYRLDVQTGEYVLIPKAPGNGTEQPESDAPSGS